MMMAGTAEFLHCTTPITTANKSPRPSDRPHSSIAEYIGKLGIPKGRHAERREGGREYGAFAFVYFSRQAKERRRGRNEGGNWIHE